MSAHVLEASTTSFPKSLIDSAKAQRLLRTARGEPLGLGAEGSAERSGTTARALGFTLRLLHARRLGIHESTESAPARRKSTTKTKKMTK
ncbi:MAG: hypothetical protein ABTQ32_40310, partial [Myxococcaceae bacterium]